MTLSCTWKESLLYFFYIFIFLTVLDIISTLYALKINAGTEGNALMSTVVSNPTLFIGIKIIGVIIIMKLYKKIIEKNTKIAYAGMRIICILMLFVVGNNLFVISAAAESESGSLLIDAATSNSYQITSSGNAGLSAGSWSSFAFDVSDYNSITQFTVSGSVTCTCDTLSVPFTISGGGSGSGILTYTKSANIVKYLFYDTIITSSPVTLSFSGSLSDLNRNMYTNAAGVSVSITQPVILGSQRDASNTAYIVQTRYTVVNNYIYNLNTTTGFFTINVNKSPSTVATKWGAYNNTSVFYFNESTFNTVSFNYSDVYINGTFLKMSVASGLYTTVQMGVGASVPYTPLFPEPILISTGSGFVDYTSVHVTVPAEAYYNNTKIPINYDLRFIISHENYTALAPIISWGMVVIDPLGIEADYDINVPSCSINYPWWYSLIPLESLIFDNAYYCESTGSYFYTADKGKYWINGTYTVLLFEKYLNTKANLASDSWEILENGTQSIGTPINNPGANIQKPAINNTIDFLGSKGFIALIIFIGCIAVGATGGVIGVVIAFMGSIPLLWIAGLIPLWIVFLDAGIVLLSVSVMVGMNLSGKKGG